MEHMNKNRILEIAFETIKDSTEWGQNVKIKVMVIMQMGLLG